VFVLQAEAASACKTNTTQNQPYPLRRGRIDVSWKHDHCRQLTLYCLYVFFSGFWWLICSLLFFISFVCLFFFPYFFVVVVGVVWGKNFGCDLISYGLILLSL
jgi:hypothetical protein